MKCHRKDRRIGCCKRERQVEAEDEVWSSRWWPSSRTARDYGTDKPNQSHPSLSRLNSFSVPSCFPIHSRPSIDVCCAILPITVFSSSCGGWHSTILEPQFGGCFDLRFEPSSRSWHGSPSRIINNERGKHMRNSQFANEPHSGPFLERIEKQKTWASK